MTGFDEEKTQCPVLPCSMKTPQISTPMIQSHPPSYGTKVSMSLNWEYPHAFLIIAP